jgi:2-polyprenyl-6-methoxyphenol hydroxylase-like FAD-dependent oxidoreductase
MRKIAIVGAGQAGLQLGFGLLQRGVDVTVFSDRTAEETLNGRVLATAFLFDRGLSYERELGLNFWDDQVRWGEGVHLDFCPVPRNRLLAMEGRFRVPGHAIDQRLKFSRWMLEFERRGGRLVVRPMTLADLDQVAAEHDLTVVAAGKGEISALFERDPRRSTYAGPQRNLALVVVAGMRPWPEIPFHPVKFTFFGSDGEIFWIPFHDRTAGSAYAILFENRIGRGMDRFGAAQDGEEMLAIARQLVAEFAPWERGRLDGARLTDPLAWQKGAITPTVRRPVGHLPSGRLVMGLGDTLILNDPIAGQGANCAAKAAHLVTQRIAERGPQPFDAEWMETVFDEFWAADGKYITAFSNLFLEPLTPAAREVVLAGSKVPEIADEFFDNFNQPQNCWPWIEDTREARRYVAEKTGEPWLKTATAARFTVLRGQLQRRFSHEERAM